MKAKRILAISLCLLLTCGGNLFAQNAQKAEPVSNDEIALHYGRISVPAVAMTFGSLLGIVFTGGHFDPDRIGSSGAIGAEYFHFFNRTFAVGGSAVFENCFMSWDEKTGTDSHGNPVTEPAHSSNTPFVSLLPGIKLRWFYKPHVAMYSKFCAGILIEPGASTATFNFQVNPAGLEVGSEKVRGFAEAGFGSQGVILAGVRIYL